MAASGLSKLYLSDESYPQCPFADTENSKPYDNNPSITGRQSVCPFHKLKHRLPAEPPQISKAVQVKVSHGTFMKGGQSAQLLRDIGGGARIREMTTRFYAHTFKDVTLDPFMFMGDGAVKHGQRLGDWIIEKMGGEGEPWTNSGR